MNTSLLTCSTLAVATVVASAATSTTHANDADLQTQIEQLRTEVARLRAADDNANWLTEQRAAEIRGLVHDVLADADTRASLLGSGMTAGWDNGFKIGSADGNYALRIAGRHQFRYVYNYQDNSPTDDHRSGFENRRTRLTFSGHVFDPSWSYQIQGNFGSGSGGGFGLLDAYVDKKLDNGLTIRFGQFRPKFMHEDHTSSARQLAVERSTINGTFAQSRTQGVELRGDVGDNFRWSAGYTEGINARTGDAGAGANTGALARTTEYAFIGRVDFLASGSWRQFRDFTSWSNEDFGLLLGAGAAWQRDEFGTTDDGEVEVFRWTVDATAKFGGFGLFAAFVGNHEDTKGGGSVDQYGLVVQGSIFLVPDEWELFARYEWGDADSSAIKDFSFVTVGVNRYIHGHNLKWQTDVGIGINEVDGFWASSGRGTRADAPGEDTQVVIRSQIQLAF